LAARSFFVPSAHHVLAAAFLDCIAPLFDGRYVHPFFQTKAALLLEPLPLIYLLIPPPFCLFFFGIDFGVPQTARGLFFLSRPFSCVFTTFDPSAAPAATHESRSLAHSFAVALQIRLLLFRSFPRFSRRFPTYDGFPFDPDPHTFPPK